MVQLPYAEDFLARHLPLYGPYDAECSAFAGELLTETVRYLNHATQHDESLPWPATIGGILSNLTATVYSLEQLYQQLRTRFATLTAHPDAYVDGYPVQGTRIDSPQAAADLVLSALAAAARDLTRQQSLLEKAAEAANRVGIRTGNE